MNRDQLKKLYSDSFSALREAGRTIVIAVIIFLASVSIGMIHPSWADDALSSLRSLARHLSGKSLYTLVLTIFLKNALSSTISVVTGPLLGIIPISAAIVNGLLLGSTASYLKQINKAYAIIYLLPHGVFEFPAMFMAWGLGLWQGAGVFHQNLRPSFRERRNKAFTVLFIVILPLLLIAATIEGTTIYVAKMN